MNILVMGIGNLLLRDEGAGVRVVEALARQYEMPDGVELLDGGTSGIELLQYIMGRDALLLIDVVRNGTPAGTLSRFEDEDVPALFQKNISPHQLGIADLLATARLVDRMPEKVVLFGIEPDCIDTGLELSDVVAGSLDRLTDLVVAELQVFGLQVKPKGKGLPAVGGGQLCIDEGRGPLRQGRLPQLGQALGSSIRGFRKELRDENRVKIDPPAG